MRELLIKYGPRTIAAILVISLGMLFGCGGSAGVENGTILGQIFSDASSASSARSPIAGATVVINRQGAILQVIRRTLTDANGNYVFTDVPVGNYQIGFAKEGFIPISSTLSTSTTITNQTALNLFVEPGQTVVVQDVTLQTNLQTGSGVLILTVLDAITGDPIINALVSCGPSTTSNGGNNGVYTLSVPVQPTDVNIQNTPLQNSARQIAIQADGYANGLLTVGIVANQTVAQTIYMQPLQVQFEGLLRISQFQSLYNLNAIDIKITNTTGTIVGPDADGVFTIAGVPASNSNLTRTFNIRFTNPDLQTLVLTNVVSPRAGATTIPQIISLNPTVVDVTGTVFDSGTFPPNGTVTIQETGQSAAVVNGQYTIPAVPTRAFAGHPNNPLTLQIRVINRGGGLEQGTVQVSPVSNGSPNPIFVVATVRTG
jgi:hypothetical protein